MDRGFGIPWGDQKPMISGPEIRNKICEVFFRWILGPQEILQKSFSDGQGQQFQKFLNLFLIEMWPLLKSFKNDVPMVGVIQFTSFSSFFWGDVDPLENLQKRFSDGQGNKTNLRSFFKFFFMKMTPREIMKTRPFGQSLNPGALGTPPGCNSAKFCSG